MGVTYLILICSLFGTVAALCDNTCETCQSGNPFGCTTCKAGYYYYVGFCLSCLNNCAVCTSGLTCNECKIGYYQQQSVLGQFICSPCSSTCKACATTSTRCTKCHSGFGLADGTCVKCQEGEQVDQSGHCSGNLTCNGISPAVFGTVVGVLIACIILSNVAVFIYIRRRYSTQRSVDDTPHQQAHSLGSITNTSGQNERGCINMSNCDTVGQRQQCDSQYIEVHLAPMVGEVKYINANQTLTVSEGEYINANPTPTVSDVKYINANQTPTLSEGEYINANQTPTTSEGKYKTASLTPHEGEGHYSELDEATRNDGQASTYLTPI